MADVVAAWVGPSSGVEMRGRAEPARGSPGYGVFACAGGGFVSIAVISEDHFWRGACDALALTELRDLDYAARLDRIEECNAALAAALRVLDRDRAVEMLAAAGVPVAPVLRPEESAEHEQFLSRRVFVPNDDGPPRTAFPGRLSYHPFREAGTDTDADAVPLARAHGMGHRDARRQSARTMVSVSFAVAHRWVVSQTS